MIRVREHMKSFMAQSCNRREGWHALSVGLIGLFALSGIAVPREAHSDRLWEIVNKYCVANAEHFRFPCVVVNLGDGRDNGYVVIKDINSPLQLLLIPTKQITGKDNSDFPKLTGTMAPNYFEKSWHAIDVLQALHGATFSRDEVSLALNSFYNRTERQLHIHIDRLDQAVATTLRDHESSITKTWAPFDFRLAGRKYRTMRLEMADLKVNPFELLEQEVSRRGGTLGEYTLVVIGWTFQNGQDGFVLLEDKIDADHQHGGHGEDLQDHGSSITPSASSAKSQKPLVRFPDYTDGMRRPVSTGCVTLPMIDVLLSTRKGDRR
jgi:CDP-diacylglycerol pyrophosphatase